MLANAMTRNAHSISISNHFFLLNKKRNNEIYDNSFNQINFQKNSIQMPGSILPVMSFPILLQNDNATKYICIHKY